MKFSFEDMIKHPVFLFLILLVAVSLNFYLNSNLASISMVEAKAKEVKNYVDIRHDEVKGELHGIRGGMALIDSHVLEIFRKLEYMEGRNEKSRNQR